MYNTLIQYVYTLHPLLRYGLNLLPQIHSTTLTYNLTIIHAYRMLHFYYCNTSIPIRRVGKKIIQHLTTYTYIIYHRTFII